MLPSTIGRYRIIGVLGEGGMGTVYEAVQDQTQRTVALKVIRPGLVWPEFVPRFARESEVLGRLQHPGIAQIYEAGTADGPQGSQSFFAMELVRGQTLTEYATSRSLPLEQRLEAEARLSAIPGATLSHDDVLRWLVSLYETWGSTEKARVWKERVAKRP